MVKHVTSLLAFMALLVSPLESQILNAGFENWTSGNPDNWFANNVPPTAVPITQSSSAHSGSSAVQGAVVSFSSVTLPPEIFSGSNLEGFPISSRPAALHGFYKLSATGGDSLFVTIALLKSGAGIGGGGFATGTAAASYQEFVANVYYSTADIPDTVQIAIVISNHSGITHVGSVFTVDDLSFGAAVAVHDNPVTTPAKYSLSQNFPNPFNPATTISFSLAHTGSTTLNVLNVLGEVVARLVDGDLSAGGHSVRWDASSVPSGMYYYQLRSGEFTQTRKLLLLK